jgi:uncharacterized pyridoxamine 5'-phosphate oxidase family protein
MKGINEFAMRIRVGALATVEGGGARVRPFQLMFVDGARYWFCTASDKPVSAQLKAAPEAEFLLCEGPAWLRIKGRAVFVDDRSAKERILAENPMVKGIYGSADNPVFEVFYLQGQEAELRDLVGTPPVSARF